VKFKDALLSVLIIEVGIAILAVINYGATLEGLQAVTRFSGRASLGIFSLIFLFQTHRYIKLTSILSDKYYLIFAIAHGIHLVQLLTFVYLSGTVLTPLRVTGGFIAYLLIFIMPYADSLFKNSKLSEKQFGSLALVYSYYVWFIFFMTYLPRVRGTMPNVGGSYSEFVILLAWVSLMLGMKLQSQLMSRISNRNR
jgi:hypothetical protein